MEMKDTMNITCYFRNANTYYGKIQQCLALKIFCFETSQTRRPFIDIVCPFLLLQQDSWSLRQWQIASSYYALSGKRSKQRVNHNILHTFIDQLYAMGVCQSPNNLKQCMLKP